MANKYYAAGRRFEWELAKHLRTKGLNVIRAAGSHGAFDLIAYTDHQKPDFIQCKVVETQAAAIRLAKKFRLDNQPTPFYNKTLATRVKGNRHPTLTLIKET